MRLNVELLRRVQREFREDPTTCAMDIVIARKGMRAHDFEDYTFKPRCGTAMCIGGKILLITEGEDVEVNFTRLGLARTWSGDAADALGVDRETASDLFHHARWPTDLRDRYNQAKKDDNPRAAVEVTCEAIDWFIKRVG